MQIAHPLTTTTNNQCGFWRELQNTRSVPSAKQFFHFASQLESKAVSVSTERLPSLLVENSTLLDIFERHLNEIKGESDVLSAVSKKLRYSAALIGERLQLPFNKEIRFPHSLGGDVQYVDLRRTQTTMADRKSPVPGGYVRFRIRPNPAGSASISIEFNRLDIAALFATKKIMYLYYNRRTRTVGLSRTRKNIFPVRVVRGTSIYVTAFVNRFKIPVTHLLTVPYETEKEIISFRIPKGIRYKHHTNTPQSPRQKTDKKQTPSRDAASGTVANHPHTKTKGGDMQ